MDQDCLKERAIELQKALDDAAPESEMVADLRDALRPLIEAALAGTYMSPISPKQIPGGYLIGNGDLRLFHDVEEALARFRSTLSGRDGMLEAMKADRSPA